MENLATAVSLAVIVAAPFTGSIALLVPIGIIGAIPSAYRLVTRLEDRSYELDLATASDIVNVLTAPLGCRTKTPSEAVWVVRSMSSAPVPGVWM